MQHKIKVLTIVAVTEVQRPKCTHNVLLNIVFAHSNLKCLIVLEWLLDLKQVFVICCVWGSGLGVAFVQL
jgi:hypothetical protein